MLTDSSNLLNFVRNMVKSARKPDRLITLITIILNDPAQGAIRPRVYALVAGHENAVKDPLMRRKPSLATLALSPPTFDVWAPTDEEPVAGAKGGLERMINAMAGFVEPGEFRKGIATAEVRTARVDIGGRARGTGFLVGSNMLMTNWHVVERGVDGAVARFDHSGSTDGRAVKFADDWLIAHSPHDTEPNELGGRCIET